jgi:hypothetical protein
MIRAFLMTAMVSFSSMALAHVEPGFYFGKTPEGRTCFLQAFETYFEKNTPHPLNERVRMRIGADEFHVGHPPVIDPAQSVASFNHDLFQGVLPTAVGARVLIVEMLHSSAQEGPAAFQLIDHQWKSNKRSSLFCRGLRRK